MVQTDTPVRKKVKDVLEAVEQAVRVSDMLEEACQTYELGVAAPFFFTIRKYLNDAIGFYRRHRRDDSNCQGLAKRNLLLANKAALGTLVRGLNAMLAASNNKIINFPTSIRGLEGACDKLFNFVGEPVHDSESASGLSVEDGIEDGGAVPVA